MRVEVALDIGVQADAAQRPLARRPRGGELFLRAVDEGMKDGVRRIVRDIARRIRAHGGVPLPRGIEQRGKTFIDPAAVQAFADVLLRIRAKAQKKIYVRALRARKILLLRYDLRAHVLRQGGKHLFRDERMCMR